MRLRRALPTASLALMAATPCMANAVGIYTVPEMVFTVFVECVAVAALTIPIGLAPIRVLCSWAVTTTCTWLLMVTALADMSEMFVTAPQGFTAVVVAEVVVLGVEAWVLKLLSDTPFLRNPGAGVLSWPKAFGISLAANAASLVVGSLSIQS